VTGYGFIGPMTAMGTVFDPKDEATPEPSVTGYAAWQSAVMASLWLLWVRLSQ
jgi:hypothetical protein